MAGTKQGGINAAKTNKDKHDKEYRIKYGVGFYQHIGSLGGSTPTLTPKGFAAVSKEQRAAAGKKGGTISRKGPKTALSAVQPVVLAAHPKKHWWSR